MEVEDFGKYREAPTVSGRVTKCNTYMHRGICSQNDVSKWAVTSVS